MNPCGLDFAYPLGAVGLHSGWFPGLDPDGRYLMTPRVRVQLVSHKGHSVLTSLETVAHLKAESPQCPGSVDGLSSGAGSALVHLQDTIVKVKRCGFREGGAALWPHHDTTLSVCAGSWIENSEVEQVRGILRTEDALREYDFLRKLRGIGLNDAYHPLDVVEYQLDFSWLQGAVVDPKAAVVLCQVSSDLRVDELFVLMLAPILVELWESGELQYSSAMSTFFACNMSVSGFITHRFPRLQKWFRHVGYVLGVWYRHFHSLGLLRGYLNAWFGNEVVDTNGRLSFVDVDSASTTESISSRHVVRKLQELEYTQAMTAFWAEFENSTLHLFGLCGMAALQGFQEGYQRNVKILPLLKDTVDEAVAGFGSCRDGWEQLMAGVVK